MGRQLYDVTNRVSYGDRAHRIHPADLVVDGAREPQLTLAAEVLACTKHSGKTGRNNCNPRYTFLLYRSRSSLGSRPT
jgi:hypothetical protein